jgi:hypothetical protein
VLFHPARSAAGWSFFRGISKNAEHWQDHHPPPFAQRADARVEARLMPMTVVLLMAAGMMDAFSSAEQFEQIHEKSHDDKTGYAYKV